MREKQIDIAKMKNDILAETYVDSLIEEGKISEDMKEEQLLLARTDLNSYKTLTAQFSTTIAEDSSDADEDILKRAMKEENSELSPVELAKKEARAEIEAEMFVQKQVDDGVILPSEARSHVLFAKSHLKAYKTLLNQRNELNLGKKVVNSFKKDEGNELSFVNLCKHLNNEFEKQSKPYKTLGGS
ncbi:MAG: hypothetical protein LBC39_02650 [Methanobrevibacter sp.]|jgi:hypothetical protein|nr:hypothetical protein [Candidatus Methanovirga aequatorialis]